MEIFLLLVPLSFVLNLAFLQEKWREWKRDREIKAEVNLKILKRLENIQAHHQWEESFEYVKASAGRSKTK